MGIWTVRLAEGADAGILARLLEAFNGGTISTDQAARRLAAVENVETVALVSLDGQPVGFGSLRLVPYLSDDAPYAELTELYVSPPFRRRGAGRALVEYLLRVARARGAAEVLLLVNPANTAGQALYGSLGFQRHAVALRRLLAD
jgi:ribosomal protein S18 acetylase RimI-like enzyme